MRHFKIIAYNKLTSGVWYKEIFCFNDGFYNNTPLINILPGDGWRTTRNDEDNGTFEPIIIV